MSIIKEMASHSHPMEEAKAGTAPYTSASASDKPHRNLLEIIKDKAGYFQYLKVENINIPKEYLMEFIWVCIFPNVWLEVIDDTNEDHFGPVTLYLPDYMPGAKELFTNDTDECQKKMISLTHTLPEGVQLIPGIEIFERLSDSFNSVCPCNRLSIELTDAYKEELRRFIDILTHVKADNREDWKRFIIKPKTMTTMYYICKLAYCPNVIIQPSTDMDTLYLYIPCSAYDTLCQGYKNRNTFLYDVAYDISSGWMSEYRPSPPITFKALSNVIQSWDK